MEETIQSTLAELRKKIDPNLLNNPLFESCIRKAYKEITDRSRQESVLARGIDSRISKINVEVASDGKSITISEEYANPGYNEKLSYNRELVSTSIYLDQNNSMIYESSKGTLFDANSYTDCLPYVERQKFLNAQGQFKGTEQVIFDTSYTQSVYLANGMQTSISTFYDKCSLPGNVRNIPLEGQLLSELHKPKFFANQTAQCPKFSSSAGAYNCYRDVSSPGICVVKKVSDIQTVNGTVTASNVEPSNIYPVHTEHPEALSYVSDPIAVWDNEKKEYVGTGDTAGMTYEQIETQANQFFMQAISSSTTNQSSINSGLAADSQGRSI